MGDEGSGTGSGNGIDPMAALAKLMQAKGDPSVLTPDAVRAGVSAMGFDPAMIGSLLMGNVGGTPGAGAGAGAGVAPAAPALPIGAVMEPGGGVAAPGMAMPPGAVAQRAAGAAALKAKRAKNQGQPGQGASQKKQLTPEQFLNRAGSVLAEVMQYTFGDLPVIFDIRGTPEGIAVAFALPEDEDSPEERLYAKSAPMDRLGDLFMHVVNESCGVLDSAVDDDGEGGGDDDEEPE